MLHRRPIRGLILGLIVLLATVGAVLFASSGPGQVLEDQAVDYRFRVRNAPAAGVLGLYHPPPLHPDIVILGLDRKTYEAIEEPSLTWNPLYADVFRHVAAAGPKALGVDLLQTVPLDAIKAGGDEALAEVYAACRELVLVYAIRPTGQSAEPQYPVYRNVLPDGDAALGAMNLQVDPDGTVRRQALVRGDRPGFAFQLLRRYTGAHVDAGAVQPGQPFSLGPFTIPWDDSFAIPINYVGPGYSFPSISFVDALARARQNDLDYFKRTFGGKLVLVGELDPLVFADMRMTPYFGSRREMTPGVEVHANVLNTILTGQYLRGMSPLGGHMLALAAAALTVLAVYTVSTAWTVSALFGVAALVTWVGTALFSLARVEMPLTEALVAVVLTGLGVMLFRTLLVDRHAANLRSIFEKYVTPQVVNEILKSPHRLSLGGEAVEATVVFTDINSFTTISHDMDPVSVISFLNEYFEVMTRIVLKYEGTLQAFLGDGLMIIFGAPIRHGDHALRAVRMSIDMMEAMEVLARQRMAAGQFPYWIKIGINTGQIVVGNLGSSLRMEYTSIGDAVNLSSRIMDATKACACDILISRQTYEEVKDKIACIDRGGVKVKGVEEPIHVFEVVGEVNASRPRPVYPGPRAEPIQK